jgi:hypothetical protein
MPNRGGQDNLLIFKQDMTKRGAGGREHFVVFFLHAEGTKMGK